MPAAGAAAQHQHQHQLALPSCSAFDQATQPFMAMVFQLGLSQALEGQVLQVLGSLFDDAQQQQRFMAITYSAAAAALMVGGLQVVQRLQHIVRGMLQQHVPVVKQEVVLLE